MNFKSILVGMLLFVGTSLNAQKRIAIESLPNLSDMYWENKESRIETNGHSIVANVSEPTADLYLPSGSTNPTAAIVIAPGGGFHLLSMNTVEDFAKWCIEHQMAALVLRYRIYPTGDDPQGEFAEKVRTDQAQMDRDLAPYIQLANADGLAAISYLRTNASQFNIDPEKIGIIGFSAGGTLAAAAALNYTDRSNRPDFSAPIYGAMHVLNLQSIPKQPMPLFIAVTSDDFFGFQNQSIELYQTWNLNKQDAELHIYENGGHGFGVQPQKTTSDLWLDNFLMWMQNHQLLN